MSLSKLKYIKDTLDKSIKESSVNKIEDYIKFLGKKQKEFIFSSGRKVVIIKGGARSGKTAVAKFAIPYLAEKIIPPSHPKYNDVGYGFIGSKTKQKAVEFYWEKLKYFNNLFNLNWKFDSQNHRIFSERTVLIFYGLKDLAQANYPFGFPLKFIFIDEPQTIDQKILKHTVEEAAITRTADYTPHSKIYMMANPAMVPASYLTTLFKNPECHVIHTTMHDNPMFHSKQWKEASTMRDGKIIKNESIDKFIERTCKLLQISVERSKTYPPTARQIWGRDIVDKERIVFFPTKDNLYEQLPNLPIGDWEIIMGIDIGYEDANAIVISYYNEHLGKCYVEYENSYKKQDVQSLATIVKRLQRKYDIHTITMDQAGAGAKNIAAEMESRYDIYGIVPAKKQDKKSYISILQAEINSRNILFKKSNLMNAKKHNIYPSIYEELPRIIWDENHKNFDRKKGYHSDRIDALIYSYRFIQHHFKKWKPPVPKELTYEEKLDKMAEDESYNYDETPNRVLKVKGFNFQRRRRLGLDQDFY